MSAYREHPPRRQPIGRLRFLADRLTAVLPRVLYWAFVGSACAFSSVTAYRATHAAWDNLEDEAQEQKELTAQLSKHKAAAEAAAAALCPGIGCPDWNTNLDYFTDEFVCRDVIINTSEVNGCPHSEHEMHGKGRDRTCRCKKHRRRQQSADGEPTQGRPATR